MEEREQGNSSEIPADGDAPLPLGPWRIQTSDSTQAFRGFRSMQEYWEFLADLGIKMLTAVQARKAG